MKISTFLMFMLTVSAVFFIFSMMVNEGNQQYASADINSSKWDTRYDFVSSINSTVAPIQEKFKVIQDEKQGFFTKLAAGITAIPYAVIVLPESVLNALVIGGTLTTNILSDMGIPVYLIILVLVAILIWGIFKLLEFFQRVAV